MKKNSPGCTCCQPVVFGNQQLWILDIIRTGAGYNAHRGKGYLERGTFHNSPTGAYDTMIMDAPAWLYTVNSTVASVPDDAQMHIGQVISSEYARSPIGFYHELY